MQMSDSALIILKIIKIEQCQSELTNLYTTWSEFFWTVLRIRSLGGGSAHPSYKTSAKQVGLFLPDFLT